MPKTRLGWFLFGLLFIILGFMIYSQKGWHFGRFGPTHHTAGYLFLIGGLVLTLFAILKKDFPKEKGDEYMMCVSCLKPSFRKELRDEKCPFCNGIVEELKGFYERHPKLKD